MITAPRSRTAVWATLALVLVVSLWVRGENSYRVPTIFEVQLGQGVVHNTNHTWYSADPDSHYHMRRLERALLSNGEVQVRDPLLAFPDFEAQGGAPIPWPGMYTRVLHTALAPWAPSSPAERSVYVEQNVARAPWILGALTSVLVALAASRLGGTRAALFAGFYHAFSFAALRYSRLGNGDHHAWVSFLHLGLLLLAARGLEIKTLTRVKSALLCGCLAGALAGLALASWVASLLLIGVLDIALLWRMLRAPAATRRGLGVFGASFHLVAAFVISPDVFASPWGPWEIINLSTFHLLFLVAGSLACVPYLLCGRVNEQFLDRYPRWLGGTALVAGGLSLFGPLAESFTQGLSWATGSNVFMGRIFESQPLGWGLIGGIGACTHWLGWGLLLLPLAWWHGARRAHGALLPYLLASLLLLAMALFQRRFAEGLAAPMAILLGVWFAHMTRGLSARRAPMILFALASGLPMLAQPGTVASTWSRSLSPYRYPRSPAKERERGLRILCSWLRTHGTPDEAVLAQWDLGHMIEWAAGRPTVATNFGLYLGLDSFLDPWRFLLAGSDEEAKALCEHRRVRHVLLGSDWARNLDTMGRALADDPAHGQSDRPLVLRLLPCRYGAEVPGQPHPDFLRLVAFGETLSGGMPAGWIWECVPAAVLEVRGAVGQVLRARVRRVFSGQEDQYVWMGEARVEADGVARLRVPWSTEDEESGAAAGPLSWTLGEQKGRAYVPLQAVLNGEPVQHIESDQE